MWSLCLFFFFFLCKIMILKLLVLTLECGCLICICLIGSASLWYFFSILNASISVVKHLQWIIYLSFEEEKNTPSSPRDSCNTWRLIDGLGNNKITVSSTVPLPPFAHSQWRSWGAGAKGKSILSCWISLHSIIYHV